MPFFKLNKVRHNHLSMDELILSRKEDTGDVEHSLSVKEAREIPEGLLGEAQTLAARFGYHVVEADAPEEQDSESQPVGDDVRGMSPTVGGAERAGGQPGATDQGQAPAPPQGTPTAGQVQSGQSGVGSTSGQQAPASTSGQAAPAPGSTTTS